MSSPTLVLVTTSFPIAGDGSEAAGSFVADLAEELAKHARVRVVAPGARAVRENWIEGVEVIRYKAPARPLSTLKPWHPVHAASLLKVLHGGLQATRIATSGGATHVFALWGLPCGEWARRVARETGIDYSVWMLGSDVWTLGRVPVLRAALARVIRNARHAYADGYKLADEARRISGERVDFLPSTRRVNLVDPPRPRRQAPYRLLFLGRWHPNKGVDLLLGALELLDDTDWKSIERVEIQGGGPLEDLVHERVGALRRAGRPVDIGRFLTKAEAELAFAHSDWVLIPSRIESIPVVFSDSMKLGRPVIAMPVGDLPRVLRESHCGLVAESVTSDAFASAIRHALSGSPEQYVDDLKLEASRFDLGSIARKFMASVASNE